ncbi:hypothetical protein C8R43DRAFT_1118422 [Mycena crocata]|nr:hypothetical protein C8R43DRAFT_1118422 [Mycena crocata]
MISGGRNDADAQMRIATPLTVKPKWIVVPGHTTPKSVKAYITIRAINLQRTWRYWTASFCTQPAARLHANRNDEFCPPPNPRRDLPDPEDPVGMKWLDEHGRFRHSTHEYHYEARPDDSALPSATQIEPEVVGDLVPELEEAQAVLLGHELQSVSTQREFAGEVRGPHLAIILGHQRQSSVELYLTAWHRAHQNQVNEFLERPVMKRIFNWVSDIVRLVWPGLALRFEIEREAAWHKKKYGITPLFGYFWNFCVNAVFPGQKRIHTGPWHVDFKNQVVLQTVYTDEDVDIPTPENSHPISMTQLDVEAHQPSASSTTDYRDDCQAAFRSHVQFHRLPEELIDELDAFPPDDVDE